MPVAVASVPVDALQQRLNVCRLEACAKHRGRGATQTAATWAMPGLVAPEVPPQLCPAGHPIPLPGGPGAGRRLLANAGRQPPPPRGSFAAAETGGRCAVAQANENVAANAAPGCVRAQDRGRVLQHGVGIRAQSTPAVGRDVPGRGPFGTPPGASSSTFHTPERATATRRSELAQNSGCIAVCHRRVRMTPGVGGGGLNCRMCRYTSAGIAAAPTAAPPSPNRFVNVHAWKCSPGARATATHSKLRITSPHRVSTHRSDSSV